MNKNYLKFFGFIIFSMVLSSSVSAQALRDYNKFSVDVAGGLHIPVQGTAEITSSEYMGFNQFEAGIRYMLNMKFGLRAFFAMNKFDGGKSGPGREGNEIDYHNTFTRVGVEGVANLGDLFKMNPRFLDKNGILARAGAGLTYSAPADRPGKTDRMGILVFGITPQRKLSERFAIFANLDYVVNLKQHYTFSGLRFEHKDSEVGGFMNINVGLTYYIGGNKEHSDWYWGN